MTITKVTKGRSFGGAIDYLFYERAGPQLEREQELLRALDRPESPEMSRDGPELEEDLERSKSPLGREDEVEGKAERKLRGELITGNVAGRTPEEIQREMEAVAARRPEVERKVLHTSISTRAEDNVTPETQARMAEMYAARRGLDKTAWIAVRHENDHGEFHMLSPSVDYKGRTISDSKDFERSEEIARNLTREFNLTPDIPSKESMRKCLTQAEMKYGARTGKPSARAVLQEITDDVISRGVTATEFIERLEERGVEVVPYFDRKNEVRGIGYRLDGKLMRGSDLGRGYSWPGLQKEWPHHRQYREGRVEYERERDYPAISKAGEREEERIRAATARERRDDERADRATGRTTETDSRTTKSHREESDPPATERGRVHETSVPAH